MNYMKKIGESFLFTLFSMLILTFIMTTLNFCNIIGTKTVNLFEMIIPIFSLFLGGFIIGRHSKKRGWLEGLKYGCILLVIMALFNYLGLHNAFTFKYLFYYSILLVSSIFGSMLGISFQKK